MRIQDAERVEYYEELLASELKEKREKQP
jgi:hypothetical protein